MENCTPHDKRASMACNTCDNYPLLCEECLEDHAVGHKYSLAKEVIKRK